MVHFIARASSAHDRFALCSSAMSRRSSSDRLSSSRDFSSTLPTGAARTVGSSRPLVSFSLVVVIFSNLNRIGSKPGPRNLVVW
jgi:hypothetical protein